MAFWVGLTGGIGSGKSQAAAEFASLGVEVVDADAVGRGLTAEGGAALPAIRAAFGGGLFDESGRLNRAKLRDLVFRRPQVKSELENILHPLILAEIQKRQESVCAVYAVAEIPLLVEMPEFAVLTDRILVIDVCAQTQIRRVNRRSGLEEAEIKRIMVAQAPRRDRLLAADDVLSNEGAPEELAAKVRRLHRYYQAYFSCLSGADR